MNPLRLAMAAAATVSGLTAIISLVSGASEPAASFGAVAAVCGTAYIVLTRRAAGRPS